MTSARTALLALLLSLPISCTVEKADIGPDGRLDVLGPVPGFVGKGGLPGDWVIEGPDHALKDNLSAVTHDRIPALKVTAGKKPFIAALRTQALMLATPYLSWSWNMEIDDGGRHPVRLVVGFERGKDGSMTWKSRPQDWFGNTLPPHERAITIAWGESALERGSLHLPKGADAARRAPRYTARGGRENTYTWWLETVDLARIYAQAWPGEDYSRVRITFIGVATDGAAAQGGGTPPTAYISGIRLNR